jgi:carboxypeptidase Taq
MSAYQQLEGRFRRLSNLEETANFLHWDAATMMPEGGAESRAEQLATLRVLCHEMLADPALGELLGEAGEPRDLGDWERANLREMRRLRAHAAAVDGKLVEALSLATSACEMAWREARPKSDFAAVRPSLEKVLGLVRRVAEAKAAALGCSLYDALLDQYEPGGRSAEIDRLFESLARFLPDFLQRVLDRQAARPPVLEPKGPFPITRQRDLAERMMKVIGFEFRHGRLDVSLHPFCGGTPDDVRITTRYSDSDFTKGLMGVLHETGHALYDRGLPAAWRGQPVGRDRGMSVHESQSLLIEMQACRSRAFLEYAAPLMREAFGGEGPAWEPDNLHRIYTTVTRSMIRVDADEVSYPAHIILRYRLERALIEGDMKVAELPGAWNDGMKALLGVVPPDDRRGCLQDIHWYDGAWGYFPTYTLGAMTAAQLFDAARRASPDIMAGIRRGDFGPLRAWLREKVHSKASLLSTAELVTSATGRPLNPEIYERYLESRYLGEAGPRQASTAAAGAA